MYTFAQGRFCLLLSAILKQNTAILPYILLYALLAMFLGDIHIWFKFEGKYQSMFVNIR